MTQDMIITAVSITLIVELIVAIIRVYYYKDYLNRMQNKSND